MPALSRPPALKPITRAERGWQSCSHYSYIATASVINHRPGYGAPALRQWKWWHNHCSLCAPSLITCGLNAKSACWLVYTSCVSTVNLVAASSQWSLLRRTDLWTSELTHSIKSTTKGLSLNGIAMIRILVHFFKHVQKNVVKFQVYMFSQKFQFVYYYVFMIFLLAFSVLRKSLLKRVTEDNKIISFVPEEI